MIKTLYDENSKPSDNYIISKETITKIIKDINGLHNLRQDFLDHP